MNICLHRHINCSTHISNLYLLSHISTNSCGIKSNLHPFYFFSKIPLFKIKASKDQHEKGFLKNFKFLFMVAHAYSFRSLEARMKSRKRRVIKEQRKEESSVKIMLIKVVVVGGGLF